jgi:hypothetical protein
MEQHGYEVSQQWQSRFDELRVISDKKAATPPCDWRRTRSYCTGCKRPSPPSQVRPRPQEPYNNVAATLKRSPIHVRNPTLSAIVEDYFALLALGDL